MLSLLKKRRGLFMKHLELFQLVFHAAVEGAAINMLVLTELQHMQSKISRLEADVKLSETALQTVGCHVDDRSNRLSYLEDLFENQRQTLVLMQTRRQELLNIREASELKIIQNQTQLLSLHQQLKQLVEVEIPQLHVQIESQRKSAGDSVEECKDSAQELLHARKNYQQV